MYVVKFSEQELRIARQGMSAFLHDFSHDQAGTIVDIRAVLARLDAAEPVADAEETAV